MKLHRSFLKIALIPLIPGLVIANSLVGYASETKLASEKSLKSLDPATSPSTAESPSAVFDRVVGSIVINQPAERLWPIVANPFEFEEFICPSVKNVAVLKDTVSSSIMDCSVNIGFLMPPIKYTVLSEYQIGRSIIFRSLGGDLKDFSGRWEVTPLSDNSSRVTYSMSLQPKLPVPQWMVKQLEKFTLPRVLTALKKRTDEVYGSNKPLCKRALTASRAVTIPVTVWTASAANATSVSSTSSSTSSFTGSNTLSATTSSAASSTQTPTAASTPASSKHPG